MMKSRHTSIATMVSHLTETVGANKAIAPMIVPPDGGWGWVIVIVCTISYALCDGMIDCVYLFREPMSKDLNIEESDISYLTSLNLGFYFLGAVFGCSFGNHWGFRITMIVGSIVTALCYTSGYFFHDIIYYFIMIGVISGMSSGFISMAANLPPAFYFDKKRSIAFGIVSCGSGLGAMVMPQIIKHFMENYGWRNTYFLEAGLILITFFCALLIRPLKPVVVVIDVEIPRKVTNEDSLTDVSAFRIPVDAFSYVSVGKSLLVDAGPQLPLTIADMADDMSVFSIKVNADVSSPTILTRLHQMTQSRRASQVLQPSASLVIENTIHITQEPLFRQKLPWYRCGCCRSKYVNLPERPLLRDDLYYMGSLMRLPEYTKRNRDLDYHMQVTRVPTYIQVVQDLVTRSCSTRCCKNLFTGLRYLIDYTMFKYLAFDCLALCGFGTFMTFYIPYVFLKVHLDHFGEGNKASTLVSLIGLGSMLGRLLSGVIITSCPKFDARTLLTVMTYVSAASITSMALFSDIYVKAVCMFIFGFTVGYYTPLRSLIIVDYFGLHKLTSGTGVLIICLGLGSFSGPAIAQNVMEYTNSVNTPFYMGGICLFLSGSALLPMDRLSKWDKKREDKKRRSNRLHN